MNFKKLLQTIKNWCCPKPKTATSNGGGVIIPIDTGDKHIPDTEKEN